MTQNEFERRFGANYQAPARKLSTGDIVTALILALGLSAMVIL